MHCIFKPNAAVFTACFLLPPPEMLKESKMCFLVFLQTFSCFSVYAIMSLQAGNQLQDYTEKCIGICFLSGQQDFCQKGPALLHVWRAVDTPMAPELLKEHMES